jgi:hypothetical protein
MAIAATMKIFGLRTIARVAIQKRQRFAAEFRVKSLFKQIGTLNARRCEPSDFSRWMAPRVSSSFPSLISQCFPEGFRRLLGCVLAFMHHQVRFENCIPIPLSESDDLFPTADIDSDAGFSPAGNRTISGTKPRSRR